MAVRHERVIIDLDDRFTSPAARMAASAGLIRRNVDDADRSLIAFDKTVKTNESSINQLSGRLAILARAAAVLGPAFAPITTAAVPAVTGLATQLGFAAAAGGTAILAFQGVGEALSAVNQAHLEPTAANLEKARKAMENLGPDAQRLVVQLHEMSDEFKGLRDAAAAGFLPGVSDSLDNIEVLFPRFERMLRTIGSVSGDLLAEGTQSLTTDRWSGFFNYIETQAEPILTDMAHTVGDVTHGLTELMVALAPLSGDFSSGFANAADDFDKWASGVKSTAGFQEFLAYVEETGPMVWETLGALANALLQIGEAAAPLGGPVLQILETFADLVATIADSDMGTPIMAAVSALSALRLAQTAWGNVAQTTVGGYIKQQTAASMSVKTLMADVRALRAVENSAAGRARATATQNAARATAAANLRGTAIGAGKTAAAGAGVALAASGVADSMGLANTATLALMGTIAGPWGAAIGGGVGALLDLKHAGDDVQASLDGMNAALKASDLETFAQKASEAKSRLDDIENTSGVGDFLSDSGTKIGLGFKEVFSGNLLGGPTDSLRDQQRELEQDAANMERALGSLARRLSGDLNPSLGDMEAALTRAQPAMNNLGYTTEELADLSGVRLRAALRAVARETRRLDSESGRVEAFGDAWEGLGNEMLSTADRAAALKQAMDDLLGPGMNLSAATDAWYESVQGLSKALKRTEDSLFAQTKASRANRNEIRGSVSALTDRIAAQAAAGVSERKMSQTLRNGRKAIIDAGVAAGISREQMRKYINQLGLTPKVVRTAVELHGAEKARSAIQGIIANLNQIPRTKRTDYYVNQINSISKPKVERADGGEIPGPRYPYGDKVLAYLAPGEEVISNRFGQADRFRADRAAGRIPAYADGGYVHAASRSQQSTTHVLVSGTATATITDPWGRSQDVEFRMEQIAQGVMADRADMTDQKSRSNYGSPNAD